MSRQNLIFNPSFRLDTNGWEPLGGATLSVSETLGFYGTRSLEVVRSSEVGTGVRTSTPVAVQAGLPYSASIYVYIPVTSPATQQASLQLSITFLNSVSEVISTSLSSVVTKTASANWTRITLSVAQAPAGATFAFISLVQVVAGTSGQEFYVDAALFEQSPFVGEYVDNLTQSEENTFVNRSLTKVPYPNITGMELNGDISLGSLIFNTVDEDGVVWVCTNITGWWEQPNSEMPDITRGTDDGSYQVNGRYTARYLTLEGVFLPQDKSQIAQARDKLTAASNLVRRGEWLRANEGPTRASFVRLSGQPTMLTVNSRGRTEFSIGLVAPDPVKYQWNDNDPENGFFEVSTDEGVPLVINNIGTADVKCILILRGPLGADSTIVNANNNNTLRIAEPLRGRGPVGKITSVQRFRNVATITTEKPHGLIPGDLVEVYDVIDPFNNTEVVTFFTVLSSTDEVPYQFTYSLPGSDISEVNSSGVVALVQEDVLEIDTYDQSVDFNGDITGERFRIAPLVDWISLTPGNNTLTLTEDQDPFKVEAKSYDRIFLGTASGANTGATVPVEDASLFEPGMTVTSQTGSTVDNTGLVVASRSLAGGANTVTFTTTPSTAIADNDTFFRSGSPGTATLTLDRAHFIRNDGEKTIDVFLPEQATAVAKRIDDEVATLTTDTSHGFAVGDIIDISLVATVNITNKEVDTNVATIITEDESGVNENDIFTVDMATSATVITKSRTSNTVTLRTSEDHRFSIDDSVELSLPTEASISKKLRFANIATLTTTTTHDFSVGDTIEVTLPVSATIVSKTIFGTTITLGTSVAHGFSLQDKIDVDLPEKATITDFEFGGDTDYTVTLTTSVAHNFSVGDRIQVNITDDDVNVQFNGTFFVHSIVSSTKFTYLYYESDVAVAEVEVTGAEQVTNLTNEFINGAERTISSIPTTTSFTYSTVGV